MLDPTHCVRLNPRQLLDKADLHNPIIKEMTRLYELWSCTVGFPHTIDDRISVMLVITKRDKSPGVITFTQIVDNTWKVVQRHTIDPYVYLGSITSREIARMAVIGNYPWWQMKITNTANMSLCDIITKGITACNRLQQ